MFYQLKIVSFAFLLCLGAQAAQSPKVVNVGLEKSYIPVGFDDNDRVQMMVTGTFPSTCYKVDAATTIVDEAQKTIRITQSANVYGGTCLPVLVPFTQVVNVGFVGEGAYNVFDAPSGKFLGKLAVTRATHPEADDYYYAPVNDAFLIVDAEKHKTITLTGAFSDRCSSLKEVLVHYYDEVIVVQPIMVRDEGRCAPIKTRWSKTVELDSALEGTYLLHVRAMDGQAINKLVDASFIE